MAMMDEEYKARKEECEQLVANGLLEIAKRNQEIC
jgi:hypothetical protein